MTRPTPSRRERQGRSQGPGSLPGGASGPGSVHWLIHPEGWIWDQQCTGVLAPEKRVDNPTSPLKGVHSRRRIVWRHSRQRRDMHKTTCEGLTGATPREPSSPGNARCRQLYSASHGTPGLTVTHIEDVESTRGLPTPHADSLGSDPSRGSNLETLLQGLSGSSRMSLLLLKV